MAVERFDWIYSVEYWSTVSKEYFGKNREWFNQHLMTETSPSDLDRIDILALKGALKDIANKINNVIEEL